MKELLLVLIGGVCSAFGGFFATWYRARKASRIKFQETMGERKVAACGKGLELVGQLQSVLIQGTKKDALDFLYKHGDWFADNLILLPHTFVENWRSIRLNLKSVVRKDSTQRKMPDGERRDQMIEEIGETESFCDKLAKEAEEAIRKEAELPECKIRRPEVRKTSH